MVIVDSSVLIDYLANRMTPETDWLEKNRTLKRIGITSFILTEVMQGIRDDRLFAETLNALSQFAFFEAGERDLAIATSRNYRKLRKIGITIRNAIDCNTATLCIEEGHTLLHNDRDFDPFEDHLGLNVVDPSAGSVI
jgi:hypothetical protein